MTARRRRWVVLTLAIAGMWFTGPGPEASASHEAREPAIMRIRISGSGAIAEGTAFLVHQTPREHDVVHYFVTAANLLDPAPLGETRAASLPILLVGDEATVLVATAGDAVFPGGTYQGLDLAVVKPRPPPPT